MIYPDFDEVKRYARRGNVVPVYRTILADTETPVSAYLKLNEGEEFSFLLESVEGGEKIARYSFLGANPHLVFRSKGKRGSIEDRRSGKVTGFNGDPIEELRSIHNQYHGVHYDNLPRFTGGAVGWFGYDTIRLVEELPDETHDDLNLDDILVMFYDSIVVFDNVKHSIYLISNIHLDGENSTSDEHLHQKYDEACKRINSLYSRFQRHIDTALKPCPSKSVLKSNIEKSYYIDCINRCLEYIRAGDIIQVVFSQRFEKEITVPPFDIYRMLRVVNPSPYMYFISTPEVNIAGASPELFVRAEGSEIEARPIAGTRRRGKTKLEDEELGVELLASEKERAEHIMLLDLGRNDIGRVSEYGSVNVVNQMFIEYYSHVMHMVSSVKGKLRKDKDQYDALLSYFPAGTLSGAPKIRAMEIIDELEPTRRSIYGGAIAYIDYSGNLDSCITIRTLVVKDGKAYIQAGGGIVADSDPEEEYMETVNKAKAVVRAIELAESGDFT